MKYTLVIAALLGLTSARFNAEYDQQLVQSRSAHKSALHLSEDSESDSDSDEDVQVGEQWTDYTAEIDHSGEHFTPAQSGMVDGGYLRATTARFAEDTDDIFMRSMIEQYSFESKNKDGSPTGSFYMTPATTKAAASEVLTTHKGLTGAEKEAYLNTYFDKAWGHFDVNKTGSVEVIKMPQFMRFLCSDQYMSLQP